MIASYSIFLSIFPQSSAHNDSLYIYLAKERKKTAFRAFFPLTSKTSMIIGPILLWENTFLEYCYSIGKIILVRLKPTTGATNKIYRFSTAVCKNVFKVKLLTIKHKLRANIVYSSNVWYRLYLNNIVE